MTVEISTGTKAARMQGLANYINSGGAAGFFALYAGAKAPNVASAPPTAPIAYLPLAYPCGSVTGVSLPLDAGEPGQAVQNGVATWARLFTSAGLTVLDCDVGLSGSGAELILSNTTLFTGGEVTFTSAVLA